MSLTRSLIAAAAMIACAAPVGAALREGAKATPFVAQATQGGNPFQFSLSQALKKGPVVLYFFPAAFTPGCTAEAHEFAEASAEFRKMGATLIGMSADPIDKLRKFSEVECRKAFVVGSATPKIIAAYDVPLQGAKGITDRTSYVIDRSGRIVYAYSAISPAGHVTGTLDAVRKLTAKR